MHLLELTRPRQRRALTLTALALALCSLARPQPARACGGFFCDQASPVLQQAERIVFVDHGDGSVTAIIEIMYSGPGDRFAWVLPVAGVPQVAVSSSTALDRLQGVTEPRLQRQFVETIDCRDFNGGDGDSGDGDGDSGDGDAGDGDGGSVVGVEAQGAVGPYDYVVISVDPNLPQPADAAVGWLEDNGYDVTNLGRDALGPYLESGMNLIAFRLSKGNSAGAIRPVQITYEGAAAIPIRPTAVAAAPDMGIMVFVLGAARAVPLNFNDVQLNEVRFNWNDTDLTGSYRRAVSRAIDEAGGKAFVTQYANASAGQLDQRIFADSALASWQALSNTNDAWGLLDRSIGPYGGWDGYLDAIAAGATLPADVTAADFVGCPRCYEADVTLDVDVLKRALYEQVILPMVQAQALLDSRPYLTRMFTTMDAADMTEDPVFGDNPDLPELPALHTSEVHLDYCQDTFFADLGQGHRYWGSGAMESGVLGPWQVDDAMPFALRIRMLGTSGQPSVLVDNYDLIDSLLPPQRPFDAEGTGGDGDGSGGGDGDGNGSDRADAGDGSGSGASGGGCSVTSAAGTATATAPWVLVLSAPMLALRRRRARC